MTVSVQKRIRQANFRVNEVQRELAEIRHSLVAKERESCQTSMAMLEVLNAPLAAAVSERLALGVPKAWLKISRWRRCKNAIAEWLAPDVFAAWRRTRSRPKILDGTGFSGTSTSTLTSTGPINSRSAG